MKLVDRLFDLARDLGAIGFHVLYGVRMLAEDPMRFGVASERMEVRLLADDTIGDERSGHAFDRHGERGPFRFDRSPLFGNGPDLGAQPQQFTVRLALPGQFRSPLQTRPRHLVVAPQGVLEGYGGGLAAFGLVGFPSLVTIPSCRVSVFIARHDKRRAFGIQPLDPQGRLAAAFL